MSNVDPQDQPRGTTIDISLAWRMFSTPPERPRSSLERRVLEQAEPFTLAYAGPRMSAGGRSLAGYAWGAGPTVYLAHGWSGASAQLGAFVEPLVSKGLRVIAVDAPAHGASGGECTNIFEFVETLTTVLREHGPIHAIVGHSLGAAAAAIAAARGHRPERYVMISVMARLWHEVTKFTERHGLDEGIERGLRAHMEAFFSPAIWDESSLARLHTNLARPTLVIHDRHDPEVDYAEVAELLPVWRDSELHSTSGLGHSATLRDGDVARRVAEFVASS